MKRRKEKFILNRSTKNKLRKHYFDTSASPLAFSSNLKDKPKSIETKIRDWLYQHDAYSLHRPIRNKFPRNQTLARGINSQFQADLFEFPKLAKSNDNKRFYLIVIDVLSRFAWVEPLKNKTSLAVSNAFEKILKESKRIPKKVQSDDGTEFRGKPFQNLMRKYNIHYFTARSDNKAAIAERCIRTLKTRIYRYLTHNKTKRFINVLPEILAGYNNTVHSSIKMRPSDVTEHTARIAYENNKKGGIKQKPKLTVGDIVRISRLKGPFAKGYEPNYSIEKFLISKVIRHRIPVYEIKDKNNEIIQGTFYEAQLTKTI